MNNLSTTRATSPCTSAKVKGRTLPSFTVKGLQEARAYLTENGGEIVSERGRSLHFRDPFGILYDIIEG